jgi:hypothetical protein
VREEDKIYPNEMIDAFKACGDMTKIHKLNYQYFYKNTNIPRFKFVRTMRSKEFFGEIALN